MCSCSSPSGSCTGNYSNVQVLKRSICSTGCGWHRLFHSSMIQSILLKLFKNPLNSNTAESGSPISWCLGSLLWAFVAYQHRGAGRGRQQYDIWSVQWWPDWFCIPFLCERLFLKAYFMPDSYNLQVSRRRMSPGQEKSLAEQQAYSVTWLLCCPGCDLALCIMLLSDSLSFNYIYQRKTTSFFFSLRC